MCGIYGILNPSGVRCLSETVGAMSASLGHRGPDDEGILLLPSPQRGARVFAGPATPKAVRAANLPYTPSEDLGAWEGDRPCLVLGHRRLSILDLSAAGHQPMCGGDGRLWIVHNGEIYNYIELRECLSGLGYTFSSHTDTEVILAAYQEWGTECFEKFIGMFACAILDQGRGQLLLARDPFGIKPLYYSRTERGLAFGSEAPVLLHHIDVDPVADRKVAEAYLSGNMPDATQCTFFDQIRRVPAGHILTQPLSGGRPSLESFDAVGDSSRAPPTIEEAAGELRRRFLDSVRTHLRSDVPVGAALSGGIDSSAIVAAVCEIRGETDPLQVFTFVPSEASFDETRWVNLLAEERNLIVHEIRIAENELADRLPELIRRQGEPFASASIYAQFRVFQRASEEGIGVVLDGQGADELFGGYGKFIVHRIAGLLRAGRIPEAIQMARGATRHPSERPTRLFLRALDHVMPWVSIEGVGRFLAGAPKVPPWLSLDKPTTSSQPHPGRKEGSLQEEMFETGAIQSLLRYEDRNSMAWSIESRVPFLTPEMAQFSFGLPSELLVAPCGTTKPVLREAMRGLLPDALVDRADKIGFDTPQNDWLGGSSDYVDDLLESPAVDRIPLLDGPALRVAWAEFKLGNRSHGSALWRTINLIEWVRTFGVRFEERPPIDDHTAIAGEVDSR